MAINYTIDANNKGVIKALQDMEAQIAKMTKSLEKTGKKSDQVFDDMTKGAESAAGGMKELIKQAAMFAGISFGAAGIKEFGKKIFEVRKEMQSLQISFETLLGSQDKANAMFGELKQFAATTPLMLKDLAGGAQTMLGFNIAAEKVVPTLKAIGDISMGDSQKFQSLTLAFSQMSATGKLMGQDLLQMINAGFNPLTEISRKTGKSISELKEDMSAGAISAEMVAEAFTSATQEGGKFYGMLEKQGKGLTGQYNQLQGAITDMFNAIGEQSEGVISGAIGGAAQLVQNYERVGKIATSLIATYGVYKAAVMAATAVERYQAGALNMTAKAQALLNKTMLANPYVLIATLIATIGAGLYIYSTRANQAVEATKNYGKELKAVNDALAESKRKTDELVSVANDDTKATEDRTQAVMDLLKKYEGNEGIIQKYIDEEGRLTNIVALKKELANLDLQQAINAERNNPYKEYEKAFNGTSEEDKRLQEKAKEEYKAETGRDWFITESELRQWVQAKAKNAEKKAQALESNKDLNEYAESLTAMPKEELKTSVERLRKIYNRMVNKNIQSSVFSLEQGGKEGRYERKDIERLLAIADGRLTPKKKDLTKEEAERAQKVSDIQAKQAKDAARQAKYIEFMTEQARIDAMNEGTQKTLEQIKLDYAKEIEEIKRQEEDLLAQKEASARALWEAENTDKTKTWANTGSKNFKAQLSEEEQQALMQKDATATANYEKKLQEQQKLEKEAMDRYLANYGTMQEKRAAIASQYQDKINKATTEGDKLTAQKEMEKAMSDFDTEALKKNINWSMLFGDLNKYTNDQLKALKPTIEKYRKSDQYKNATEENKKVVDEAYENLQSTILSKSGIFGGLAEAFQQLSDAEEELVQATAAVNNAKTDAEKEAADKRLTTAKNNKANAEANTKKAADSARDSIASLASAITSLGTASEISLSDLGALGSQIASAFGEAGQKAGGWIAAIFTICDMIAKDGLEGFAKNVGKLFGQVLGGLVGIDIDESTRYYEEQKKLNDVYLQLIDDTVKKTEELMKKQAGLDAYDSYNVAKEALEKSQKLNATNIANFLNSGASKGFLGIGSSSSEGKKLRGSFDGFFDFSEESRRGQRLKDILGVQYLSGRMTELSNATIEQIELMKEDADIWAHLPEEVRSYYQEILDSNEAVKDLRDALNETLLATSFDSLLSSFKSTLTNMDASAQDFADNIEDIFNEAIINSLVNEKYSKQLEDWYKSLAEMAEKADGIQNLTDEQIEKKRQEYMDLMNGAKAEADLVREKFGIEPSTTAASGTIHSAMSVTEDTANELVGRMTAMQIGNEQVRAIMQNVSALLQSTLGAGDLARGNEILDDIRTLMASNNGYLGSMLDAQTKMYKQLSSDLARIASNTDKL